MEEYISPKEAFMEFIREWLFNNTTLDLEVRNFKLKNDIEPKVDKLISEVDREASAEISYYETD